MSRSLWTGIILVVLCLVAFSAAAFALPPNSGQEVFQKIDADREAGLLTPEQALLYKFHYMFDHDQLPAEYLPTQFTPIKSGTPYIIEFENMRGSLSARTIGVIEDYIHPERRLEDRATYVSLSGFFLLTYSTTGVNAVPATDVNPANGIPDYVERCANYMDYSQDLECNVLGFSTPPHSPYYNVYFEAMSDAYGYTTPVGLTGSNITLHNTFLGFPPNDDPEGDQWGAAKVTCAHEFKHATQRAGSRWSEGTWGMEVDATWMEDIAYDVVNDYYNYLPYGSPISNPSVSLGGDGYEDCVWQHWMSETWGTQIITDLWVWRRTHQSQTMLNSYNIILGNYGSSFTIGWPVFTAWNYACGSAKAIPGFGYGEASSYPTSPNTVFSSYPNTQSGSVNYLAARFIRCRTFSENPGVVNVVFDGQNASSIALTAIIRKRDNTAVLERITLDGNCDADVSLSVPREQILEVGFSMSNSAFSGTATYTITISQADVAAQPAITLSDASFAPELIQNETATDVLLISNTGGPGTTLHFDASLAYLPGKDGARTDWLSIDPTTGDIAQGANLPMDFDYDAADMDPGVYQAEVTLTHNAPGSPTVIPVTLTVLVDPAASPDGSIARVFEISRAYPNPFGALTTIALSIPSEDAVVVDVVDVNGRMVRTIWNGRLQAGQHSFPWDGRDDHGQPVGAGTYFARLHRAGEMSTTKMILAD